MKCQQLHGIRYQHLYRVLAELKGIVSLMANNGAAHRLEEVNALSGVSREMVKLDGLIRQAQEHTTKERP